LETPRRNSIKLSSNSNIEASLNFSLKIYFESEDVAMEKVLPLFKLFKSIFYFKISEPGKVFFGSVKISMGLNFEFKVFKPF
jgi:hypothetical protein